MTFTRPANHRQLTFDEIAKSAKVTVNEVSSGRDRFTNVQVLRLCSVWIDPPPRVSSRIVLPVLVHLQRFVRRRSPLGLLSVGG